MEAKQENDYLYDQIRWSWQQAVQIKIKTLTSLRTRLGSVGVAVEKEL
jgi:hypothetical protein